MPSNVVAAPADSTAVLGQHQRTKQLCLPCVNTNTYCSYCNLVACNTMQARLASYRLDYSVGTVSSASCACDHPVYSAHVVSTASCAGVMQGWSHIQRCPVPSRSCSTSTARLCQGLCGISRLWLPPQSVCPATLLLANVHSTPQNQHHSCICCGLFKHKMLYVMHLT